jgi:hypothetical protein
MTQVSTAPEPIPIHQDPFGFDRATEFEYQSCRREPGSGGQARLWNVGHYRATMNKSTILGLAILLATIAGVRGQPFKLLSDQKIQRELTGTWVSPWGHGLTTTNVIAADGSYVSQTGGFTNGSTEQYRGTFMATNGMVVGRATIGKQTVVMHLYIIRLDSHELIWSNDQGVTLPPFHKVGR